jgi:uncharacterized protein YaaR (DUF327 family)
MTLRDRLEEARQALSTELDTLSSLRTVSQIEAHNRKVKEHVENIAAIRAEMEAA